MRVVFALFPGCLQGDRSAGRGHFRFESAHTPGFLAIDERTRYGFEAIGTAKSMVVAAPEQGSQYVGVYQDTEGRWLMRNPCRSRKPSRVVMPPTSGLPVPGA